MIVHFSQFFFFDDEKYELFSAIVFTFVIFFIQPNWMDLIVPKKSGEYHFVRWGNAMNNDVYHKNVMPYHFLFSIRECCVRAYIRDEIPNIRLVVSLLEWK